MDLESQPVRYVGHEFANTDYHDGQLRPVVGVHHIQVLRANHTHPEWAEGTGWTYNYAPMLLPVIYCINYNYVRTSQHELISSGV